jgi:murein DD-endopeptidase MepM/ murein hydrolase activator NlpD
MTRRIAAASALVLASFLVSGRAGALQPGAWRWPIIGPVLSPFDPPDTPFGSGHRGIDVAADPGSPLVAPAPGTVKFAGRIGGELFLSIAHGESWESTASWLSSVTVREGDTVFAGQVIGATGTGHPGASVAHVHLGVKHAGAYVDPLEVYGSLSLVGIVRLAALPFGGTARFRAPVGWAADPGGSDRAEHTAADHHHRPHRDPHGLPRGPARARRPPRSDARVGPAGGRLAAVAARRRPHRSG